ncbi:DUF805 domain-containing protein [Sulfitobacter mediterraneus]|uniref:DUF805 domain-containing protein n=1 Tax=Sulfitobacter mediterraneus TaxID=83219 RepID=UPI000EA2C58F|nr:DUF805 domain-containing protein [Sulfitobacter mediterraneus]
MSKIFWAVLLVGLLGLAGTIYYSIDAENPQDFELLGRLMIVVAVVGAGGVFANWLVQLPVFRPMVSAFLEREDDDTDDTKKQEQGLGDRVGWALVWFGGAGLVLASSAIAVLGSSPAFMLFAKVALVAGLAGGACFAVLWVYRASKNEEAWVSDIQEGAETVHVGLVDRLRFIFGFSGTIGRLGFLVSQLAIGFVQIISVFWIFEIPDALLPWLLILASAVSMLSFGARRTRDTGVNQWWFLLFLVPALNLAVLAFLLLVPTDEFKGRGF